MRSFRQASIVGSAELTVKFKVDSEGRVELKEAEVGRQSRRLLRFRLYSHYKCAMGHSLLRLDCVAMGFMGQGTASVHTFEKRECSEAFGLDYT